jgi:hypothetical protein
VNLKESLFSASGPPLAGFPREPAEMPAAGADPAFVRMMTAADSDAYEKSRVKVTFDHAGKAHGEASLENIRARLLVRCLCNDQGERLFADGDADKLGQVLPRDVAGRLFKQASRIYGLDVQDEPEKNASTPASDSASGSH